jgi:predicted  nucleic acid-binding Zn-ribbon protein
VALAAVPATAEATTDRADYDAQVNPICAATNSQAKALYASFEQMERALDRRADKAHGKKRRRLEDRADALFSQLDDQNLAIYSAEFAQLKLVAPAPGDESLVAQWLGVQQTLFDLSAQISALEQRQARLFGKNFRKIHSINAFKRLEKKGRRLSRQEDALYEQLEQVYEQDIELGAKLGASYCVTEATGQP